MFNEELCEIEMTPLRCLMERSPPTLVLGCRAGTVLDKETCEIEITIKGHQMERGQPTLALGCHVRVVLKESREVETTLL